MRAKRDHRTSTSESGGSPTTSAAVSQRPDDEYRMLAIALRDALETRSKGEGWRKLSFDVLRTVIHALAFVILGYIVTDRVTLALRSRELDLDHIREMQLTIADLWEGDDVRAAAAKLSLFGHYAIPPLIELVETGDISRALAAERALKTIALSDKTIVCTTLLHVVKDRNRRFGWLTHLSSIRLIADLGCVNCEATLRQYQAMLGAGPPEKQRERLVGAVSQEMPVTLDNAVLISGALQQALERLDDAN